MESCLRALGDSSGGTLSKVGLGGGGGGVPVYRPPLVSGETTQIVEGKWDHQVRGGATLNRAGLEIDQGPDEPWYLLPWVCSVQRLAHLNAHAALQFELQFDHVHLS